MTTKGKLLFSHEPEDDSYTMIEVYECAEKPGCQIIEISDTELGDHQRIHLSVKVRAALVEALES